MSIYEHVRAHVNEDGKLDEGGIALPDEKEVMAGELRWAPGAMDGAFGHHGGGGSADQKATEAAGRWAKAARRSSKRNLSRLYDAVSSDDVLGFIDPMIEQLGGMGLDRARVHEIARWLATTAQDRGAVKVGIAVLGATGLGPDVEVVRTLGLHEEFTLFCAVALANGADDPEAELWQLARRVDGWGRIHCVERLSATGNHEIQEWILREGFRNAVMYEYLAYIAATTGRLLEALRRSDVDRELLTAAGEILSALVMGGPAQDLDDYDEGADAVEAYLIAIRDRAETLDDLLTVDSLHTFLQRDDGWEERAQRGWTATRRQAFEDACAEIVRRDHWRSLIEDGLRSEDPVQFGRANDAARRQGIDTFDVHVRRIRAEPLGHGWFDAWNQADHDRALLLVQLARTLLPLDEIATGPGDALGLGPGWQPHQALDWTLQSLRDHPGVGGDLLVVGLQSPVIRNRNMALAALQQWPREAWPERSRDLIATIAASDPNEQTRGLASELASSL